MNLVFSDPSGCYELVPYANPAFPVYALEDHMHNSPDCRVVSHCHADFELVGIESGNMDYYVDGRHMLLKEGDIVFTNSRHFHYSHVHGKQDCWFVTLLFHPSIMCEHPWLAKRWMNPLLSEEAAHCLHFHAGSTTTQTLMDLLQTSLKHYQAPQGELHLMSVLYEVLDLLCSQAAHQNPAYDLQTLKQFRIMNTYALSHLSASVRELAQAGGVGITTCTELFRTYTGLPPAKYLAALKLKQAEALLAQSDLNQTQIALECGYTSPSYFCQCFKKVYGVSPTQYRKDLASAAVGAASATHHVEALL